MKKKNNGFTLAEVLITLVIIGVIAAITVPSLIIKNQRQELQSQLKKTFSDLNNASLNFKNREGMSITEYNMIYDSDRSTNTLEKFLTYFIGKSSNAVNYTKKQLNGSVTSQNPCDRTDYYADSSGRIFSMDDSVRRYPNVSYGPKICVDINGTKKPNRYGYDIFVFVFTKSGNILPYTGIRWNDLDNPQTSTEDIANYCKYQADVIGHTCAVFALRDTNPNGQGNYWTDFLK